MSAAAVIPGDGTPAEDSATPGTRSGRRKLLLMAAPLLLAAIVAGLWFTGILPPLLGLGHGHAETHGVAGHGDGKAEAGEAAAKGPIFLEVPELVANLNAGARKAIYVKLQIRLELARTEDQAPAKAAMPRLLDLFQTYLREMRPEELRGSAGSYRLREELTARANIALAPVRVLDVLFIEMLIQ